MKNFILIGAAGYIAPRHLKAIKETGNNLLAALDKNDSVGIIDNYFPNADFFVEFERFDRHVEKLRRKGTKIDFVSVCSPNYLHDAHIRFGLRHGADVICEKPLVLNPWNVDALGELEKESGKKIHNILQLRLHPTIKKLKDRVHSSTQSTKYNVKLKYITSRGNWYHTSWKGDITKSGGIATNIGIHFFDMLMWVFGKLESNTVNTHTQNEASGNLTLQNANVEWFLSIDEKSLPSEIFNKGQRTFRSIEIDGDELEFSDGFTDLHTQSYQEILGGKGFRLEEIKKTIELVHDIRNGEV